jgi:hypothetical protein
MMAFSMFLCLNSSLQTESRTQCTHRVTDSEKDIKLAAAQLSRFPAQLRVPAHCQCTTRPNPSRQNQQTTLTTGPRPHLFFSISLLSLSRERAAPLALAPSRNPNKPRLPSGPSSLRRGVGVRESPAAMDAMRKQLDVLMGANRNGDVEEVSRNYYDRDVCRLFLAGLCPHDLFQLTVPFSPRSSPPRLDAVFHGNFR